jgi:tRNA(fMet)-specific endonuclease VapC
MIVLDTDCLTFLHYEDAHIAQDIHAYLKQQGEALTTTVVSFEEQMRGWMSYLKAAKTLSDQVAAYGFLVRHLQLFCGVHVLPFDSGAAARFHEFRKQKLRLSSMDLKIAAIVIEHDATLVTRNLKHFKMIPGLKIEDWTKLSKGARS